MRCTSETGVVGMAPHVAEALAALRSFNYERIYTRPESLAQAESVVRLLRALVEHYAAHPGDLPREHAGQQGDDDDTVRAAVTYVAGMTDRYAFRTAVRLLDWPEHDLPEGIDVS
ncbi:hypothetical protein GCM10025868_40870 [Angustibacter aerolatus]|uniref:Phosphohydrolase-associated domain-containing protein n=1 Tax=Angustibacter aerolatus TaxID=1162965 RepID=A0ABQ6JM20_9ACTN|nr:hypothetical protein GCM10025868_40870 [Angustibacter aerolatus]